MPLLRTLLFCAYLLGAAFSATAAEGVDALGRTVRVGSPGRVVSLVPSVTEILFALGAGERVVGVTRFCDFPGEATRLPKVGGFTDPSLEAVVVLAPDLVFAAAGGTPRSIVERLDAMGVPVYVVDPRSYRDTAETIRGIGSLSGTSPRAEQLAAELEATAQAIAARAPRVPPRVLVCVMTRPLVVAGPRTLAGDLVGRVGGANVVPDGPARYPTWSMEGVLGADPDVIVISAHPGDLDPEQVFSPWPELRAVAAGRVVVVEADWIHRPGPRLTRGLEALSRAVAGSP
ncbi:MAG: helical backbone metal receptor [Deferrisomatales bacterium]|nr:helical backbone metal receptor [Deferrisomatales bacterium]